jgi:hypothetical protein
VEPGRRPVRRVDRQLTITNPAHQEGTARRPLRYACGVVAAALLGLAACGAPRDDDHAVSSVQPSRPIPCGAVFAPPPSAGLTLAGAFADRVRAGERSTLEGTVTLTNHTGRRVEGLSASQPAVYVTRARKVVAIPLPRDEVGIVLDLAPGASRDFAAAAALRSCRDGRPLPPGPYELHAVLPVGPTTAAGGPWALEIA